MEVLPRDILRLIAVTPSVARGLAATCKQVRDTTRGIFVLTINSFEGYNIYNLTGMYFEVTINVSMKYCTLIVRSDPDQHTELGIHRYGGDFWCTRGLRRLCNPQKFVSVYIANKLFLAFLDNLPIIREFSGILVNDVYKLGGYHDNFVGRAVESCEDPEGIYRYDSGGRLYRANVRPDQICGEFFELKQI